MNPKEAKSGEASHSYRDDLWQILKPTALVVFFGSCLWFIINPPTFSGAPDLLLIALVALSFTLATAWITAKLSVGEMDEETWQKLVDRSEFLATLPPQPSPPSAFDDLVKEALDSLPEEFQKSLERVAVVVSQKGQERGAYGLYVGATISRNLYPDYIVIFQDTLVRDFGWNEDLLRRQVQRVIRHELAHHLGWDEAGVRNLGL